MLLLQDTAGKLPSVGKCSRHIVIYSLKVGRLPLVERAGGAKIARI